MSDDMSSKCFKPLEILKKLIRLNSKYIPHQIILVLAILLSSFLEIVEIDAFKQMIDAAINSDKTMLLKNFFVAFGVIVFNGILYFSANYFGLILDQMSTLNIQAILVRKIFKIQVLHLKRYHSNDILSRVNESVYEAQTGILGGTRQIFHNVIIICMTLGYLSTVNIRLILVVVPFVFVVPFFINMFSHQLRIFYYEEQICKAKKDALTKDTIESFEIIKAFSLKDKFKNKYRCKYSEIQKRRKKIYFFSGIIEHLESFLVMAGEFSIIAYGAFLYTKGDIKIGGIISFLILFERLIYPFSSIVNMWPNLQKAISSGFRFMELLDMPEEVCEKKKRFMNNKCNYQGLYIDGIYKRYDNESFVLKNISFKAALGEKVLIYGDSGEGKSTLVSILIRLFEPEQGNIFWKGVSIYDYELSEWRCKIAYVSQELRVFTGTILDNIQYGNINMPEDKIYYLTKVLGIYDSIMKKEKGFFTEIGMNGVQLSGGELQRLTIARALIKDADIIILDEPSSYLDAENELKMVALIDELFVGKLVIIISHKTTFFHRADKILELKNGQLYEYRADAQAF
ncbi:ABC transporter ATP-binding protein [Paramaledivibacter caminithermalis]|nr:ABC transporter ATP-binding protein [Paramaledivibacter caminithermalis]